MSWFDESPAMLNQCLLGLQYAGCDHVVALDGKYALYPGEEYLSPAEQQGHVVLAARSLGMGCTLYVPPAEWPGEVQKRTHLFTVGLAEAFPGDWFLLVDADVVVVTVPGDLKERLEATELDAAAVTVRDMNAAAAKRADWPEYFDIRPLFRAQPIQVKDNHHTYVTLEGKKVWTAAGEDDEPEPALDLRAVFEVQHRPGARTQERQLGQQAYYGEREETGVERLWCAECLKSGKEVRAVKRVPTAWRRTSAGYISDIAELCQVHLDEASERNRRRMRTWGLLCACRNPAPDRHTGVCKSCNKPVHPETAYRVIERNGRPQIGVKPG